jgi:hypothetical protein
MFVYVEERQEEARHVVIAAAELVEPMEKGLLDHLILCARVCV